MANPFKPSAQGQSGFLSRQRLRPRLRLGAMAQAIFAMNRMYEVWHTHTRRKHSERIASNNAQLMQDNIISGRQENTELGALEDARELGYLDPFCGPLLGWLDDQPLYLATDFHIATCAFPGSGKSTSLSIPNCISLAMGETPESIVVLDVKGELSWLTAEGRSKLDEQEAIFINPWHMNGFSNTRINFFSDVIERAQTGQKTVDLCKRKIRQRFGDPERYGTNAWIYKDGIKICNILLVFRSTNDIDACCPSSFWDFGCSTHEEFVNEMTLMAGSSAGEGFVSRLAGQIIDQYGTEPSDQWRWVMDGIQDAFALYATGSALRDSTMVTDFDVRLLKQRPQAIYILIPDNYIDSHGTYVADVLDYITSMLASAKGNTRTTFLLDEFVNIPRIQSIVKALRLYRYKPIRIWTFTQDRNGYLIYKDEGSHHPFESSAVTLSWGVIGEHAQELSHKAGKHTELVATPNSSAGISADSGGYTTSEVQVDNLPVSQISQNFEGTAILDAKSKVFLIDRKPWWEIDYLREYIRDPNIHPVPFFEG